MWQTRWDEAPAWARANGAGPAMGTALLVAFAAAFSVAASGCGDDFVRNETRGNAAIDALVTDAIAGDAAAADTVANDVAADAGAADAADGGAHDLGEPDASDASRAACAAAADCAALAQGPCQEASCVSGLCVVAPRVDGTTCDDGDGCGLADRCLGGECQGGPTTCPCQLASDCTALDDKDPCNGVPYCDLSGPTPQCAVHPGTVVTCVDSGAPCQQNSCDPKTGACAAGPAPDGSACDDGQPCTKGEACLAGSCKGGKPQCACQSDADCAAQDDNNVCNGTLYCDTNSFPYLCQTNPATVVQCVADDDGGDCLQVACLPESGACASVALATGVTCSDGDSCSVGDACLQGVCQPGANTCPCKVDADCKALEDGDACNGKLYCDTTPGKAGCKVNPASVIKCPASSLEPCQTLACDAGDGACKQTPAPKGTPCQDGEVCTVGDACGGGSCVAGPNVCACEADSDCGAFEDGDVCNGSLFCDKGALPFVCKVNAKTKVSCPDDLAPCTTNACQPQTGACKTVPLPAGAPCDADGFACTAIDACLGGACIAGANVCACQQAADCAPHEDASVCNGTLFCNKSALPFVCQVNPATIVTCPAPPAGGCLVAACASNTGACSLQKAGGGTACNADGDACTSGDACVGGVCKPGTLVCACGSDADCQAKDDGDLCNGVLFCDKAAAPFACKPKPGSVVLCDPSKDTACVHNTCSAGACKLLPGPYLCDDGDACTVGDSCTQGSCKPGAKLCGCKVDADCQALDDNNLCNGAWHCALGQCAVKPQSEVTCQPGVDPCSPAQCQPSTGACVPKPTTATDGTPCEDGDDKTIGDICSGGQCLPSTAPPASVCDDLNPCTTDAELLGVKCSYTSANQGAPCGKVNTTCSAGSCGACSTWSKRYPAPPTLKASGFTAVVTHGADWLAFHPVDDMLSIAQLVRGVSIASDGSVAGSLSKTVAAETVEITGAAPADGGAVLVGGAPAGGFGVVTRWGTQGPIWTFVDAKQAAAMVAVAPNAGQDRWLAIGKAADFAATPWVVELDGNGKATASGGFGALTEPGGALAGAQFKAIQALDGSDWLVGGYRVTATGPRGLLMRMKNVKGKSAPQTAEWILSGEATLGRVFHGAAHAVAAKLAVAVGRREVEQPQPSLQAVVIAVHTSSGNVAWQWLDESGGIGEHLAVAPLGTGVVAVGMQAPLMGGQTVAAVGVLRAFDSVGKLRWARAVVNGNSSLFRAVSGSTAVSGPGAGGLAVGDAIDGPKDITPWAVRFGYDGEIFCGPKP